jgi:hypothetical protein
MDLLGECYGSSISDSVGIVAVGGALILLMCGLVLALVLIPDPGFSPELPIESQALRTKSDGEVVV